MPQRIPGLRLVLRCAALAAILFLAPPAIAKTAIEHLREAPKPEFRAGHTLFPLTRWGWSMPFDVRVELAERWGYALELGQADERLLKQLDDPQSVASRLAALTAADPKKYPLSVLTYRACLDKNFTAALPPETWCRDADGNVIGAPKKRAWSPEAPDAVFQKAGAAAAEPIKALRQKAPVAMVLNGGEYALGVYGFSKDAWSGDPAVTRARGSTGWMEYISARKARQETIIADACRAACPDRQLYIYYFNVCPHRDRYDTWWHWAWDYPALKGTSDLPSSSIYYLEFNTGWTGDNDLLTLTLNAVAWQISAGQPLSYNWVCGGWTRDALGDKAFSGLDRYTGFLKCYYAAGMLGACAGYFAYPKGGFDGDQGEAPPHWLGQITALAHVHALFSREEEFLRKGDLLAGPNRNKWSKDFPAYEFPTGDAAVRVLARRHRARPEWLIVAWAAGSPGRPGPTGGPDRDVSVTIPDLGPVRLQARPCGSVYRATLQSGRASLTRLDENGMVPTARP